MVRSNKNWDPKMAEERKWVQAKAMKTMENWVEELQIEDGDNSYEGQWGKDYSSNKER